MTERRKSYAGRAALIAWAFVVFYLGTVELGAIYDPKALLDQHPNVTPQQWAEIMGSPMQRVREAMVPVWQLSRYIIPALLLIAGVLTWRWWRVRSNPTAEADARESGARGSL
jgi:hypothetical protein